MPIVIFIITEAVHAIHIIVFLILIDPLSGGRIVVKPDDFSIIATGPSTGIGIRVLGAVKRVDPHSAKPVIATLRRTQGRFDSESRTFLLEVSLFRRIVFRVK